MCDILWNIVSFSHLGHFHIFLHVFCILKSSKNIDKIIFLCFPNKRGSWKWLIKLSNNPFDWKTKSSSAASFFFASQTGSESKSWEFWSMGFQTLWEGVYSSPLGTFSSDLGDPLVDIRNSTAGCPYSGLLSGEETYSPPIHPMAKIWWSEN